jgi:TonB family protein
LKAITCAICFASVVVCAQDNVLAPAGVYRIGGVVSEPRLLVKVEPTYTDEARRAMLAGQVNLQCVIGADGKAGNFRMQRSLGLGLDEKAIEAVGSWRFQPGMKAGQPVAVFANVEVTFRLNEKNDPNPQGWHVARVQFLGPDGASRATVQKTKAPHLSPDSNPASALITFDVNEQGQAVNFKVSHASDEAWARDVTAALREWTFTPAQKNGSSLSAPCTMEFIRGDFTSVVPAMADDTPESRIASLRASAADSMKAGQFALAEDKLNAALKECATLPAGLFHIKSDVLKDFGRLYDAEKKTDKAEAVYRSRLDLLTAGNKDGQAPDLDVGIALFDLLSLYEVAGRSMEALGYFERARSFYDNCKRGFPELRAVCDRRLADVEGLHGSVLFLQKRFDLAIPFLEAVIAREDSGVRPEVLHAALSAYAQILISRGDTATAQPLIARALRISAANPSLFSYRSTK